MKKINMFLKFDFDAFASGKQFVSTGTSPWTNRDTGELLGTKVEAVIYKDKTDYGVAKNGEKVTNLFEKVTFKVPHEVSIPVGVEIIPIDAVATVYGEYRNQLSITAKDVQVVTK